MAIPKDLIFIFLSVLLIFFSNGLLQIRIMLQSLTDHTQFKNYTEAGDDI